MSLPDEIQKPLTVAAMLDVLERCLHASRSEWIFMRELRVGTGHRNNGAQRLDAFALNCLPHQAMKRICYELKTSRADYLCELRNPLKRRMGMRYSNEFYFVTPGGMLKHSEIPAECGLIEVGVASSDEWRELIARQCGFFNFEPGTGTYCMLTVPAPWRDTPGPTWQLLAAMVRNQRRQLEEKPPEPPKQQKISFTE
jgi:hypothetical protein